MHEQRQTLIADFAIRGRLAYLSHQETLTLFLRALLRAAVPVAFSGGFNPRPRLSIPLPRSVGTQSEAERLCALLAGEADPAHVSDCLSAHLPEGCELLSLRCAEGKQTFHASRVQYQFHLSERLSAARQEHLSACRDGIQAGDCILVQRCHAKKKMNRPFDISPFLERLDFCDSRLDVTCRVSQDGGVRIDELMQWLRLERYELKEPIRRTAVQWNNP